MVRMDYPERTEKMVCPVRMAQMEKMAYRGKMVEMGVTEKDGVSPDLTNYPDTDAVKALIQAAVQPLLQQAHVHKNLNVLDDLTADELSLLRALQEFEDDTTYNIQTFREAIAALNEKAHTHENQSALDQITAAKIAQWDGFGTQINGLSTKVTVYSEKVENNTSRIGTAERTLESLQKQIDNLTSGRNYTVLFQSGQDAISTYASNLSMILDGSYQTMTDFLAAYPQFCSAANDFVLSYSQECFNWDKSVLTVCAKPLSLTKNAEIVMSYQSGSSEAGSLYLVQKAAENRHSYRRVCKHRDRCKSCGFSGFPLAAVGYLYHHHHRMHRHF